MCRELSPCSRDQPSSEAGAGADGHADEDADGQVDQGGADALDRAEALLAGEGGDGEQHERRAQPVVEPALDVEHPPHPHRHDGVEHGRGAEPGIGRGHGGREEQEHQRRHPGEDDPAEQPPGGDGQRQPDEQQPGHQAAVGGDLARAHLGGVVEEDERQGQLGEQGQGLAGALTEVGQAEREQGAGGDEGHRAR